MHFAAAMCCSSLHNEDLTNKLGDSQVKRAAQPKPDPHYYAHSYDRGYRSGFKQGFHYSHY